MHNLLENIRKDLCVECRSKVDVATDVNVRSKPKQVIREKGEDGTCKWCSKNQISPDLISMVLDENVQVCAVCKKGSIQKTEYGEEPLNGHIKNGPCPTLAEPRKPTTQEKNFMKNLNDHVKRMVKMVEFIDI